MRHALGECYFNSPALLAKMPSGWVKLNIKQRDFDKTGEAIPWLLTVSSIMGSKVVGDPAC